jgi:RNA polymerase sigma-70 factor (ECF subfamily)
MGLEPTGNATDPRRFRSTRWSLVQQAAHGADEDRAAALSDLCTAYWYPLYAFVRSRGFDAEEARDLTQGFFARLLEKNEVGSAHPGSGRFRTFLLTALSHFLANERDRDGAKKRGGGRTILSLDFRSADERYLVEPAHEETPERAYTRRFALELVDRAVAGLRREYAARGRGASFERLEEFLTTEPRGAVAGAARDLGVSEGAVRVTVHRMRARLREILRREITDTMLDGGSVDEELEELFRALLG